MLQVVQNIWLVDIDCYKGSFKIKKAVVLDNLSLSLEIRQSSQILEASLNLHP